MSSVVDLKTGEPVNQPKMSRGEEALFDLFRASCDLERAAEVVASLPVHDLAALRLNDDQGRMIGVARELWCAEVRLERAWHRLHQKQVAIENHVARTSFVNGAEYV